MYRFVAALCGVVLLAACGGDGATAGDMPPDSTPAADATASTTATTAGGMPPDSTPAADATASTTATTAGVVPIEVPPCDLLTAAEVSAATGFEVEAVIEEPPITCVFDLGSAAGVDVFVSIDDGQGRLAGPAAVFEAYATADNAEAEVVGGLGEGAFYEPGYRGLAVDAGGGRFIGLGVNGGFQQLEDPRDALVELASLALGRL